LRRQAGPDPPDLLGSRAERWAFDLKTKRWSNLQVKNRPPGGIYGSWDYDRSTDVIVSLWPDDPGGGFDDESGKSRTFLVDLARGTYREVQTERAPPYAGMSFKAPSLAAARPF
jgi:hypothetical protein